MARRRYAALFLLLTAAPAGAQVALGVGPLEPAGAFRDAVGEPKTFVCPASDGSKASVYGTDIYLDSSPICAAAIHAGVLEPGVSGAVTLVMGKGADGVKGSERNGITSLSYGSWEYTYSFLREPAPGTINWRTMWKYVPKEFEGPVELVCPPGDAMTGLVWGTDVYTTESSICVAAVHVGAINAKEGGPVAVARAPGQEKYVASERNGVSSRATGASGDAFTVSVGTALVPDAPIDEPAGNPPEEPPLTAGTPPQTPPDPDCTTPAGALAVCITLAGWTGEGPGYVAPPPVPEDPAMAPAPVPPLAVTLAGWTGEGAGYVAPPPVPEDPAMVPAPVAPLTVTLPGWTGEGVGYVEETNDDEED